MPNHLHVAVEFWRLPMGKVVQAWKGYTGKEPAIKPPWGQLNAIDLNRGELLWQVPLGEYPGDSYAAFALPRQPSARRQARPTDPG